MANSGKNGGYLNNLDVKIPLPDEPKKVEKLLRSLGQDKYAEQFVATLNHAAEKAVPQPASNAQFDQFRPGRRARQP